MVNKENDNQRDNQETAINRRNFLKWLLATLGVAALSLYLYDTEGSTPESGYTTSVKPVSPTARATQASTHEWEPPKEWTTTPEPANPTRTAEPSPTPEPAFIKERDTRIGSVSLLEPFSLIIPQDTAFAAGNGRELSFDIEPMFELSQDNWTPEITSAFLNYWSNDKDIVVTRASEPGSVAFLMHSGLADINGDWARRAYEYLVKGDQRRSIIGKEIVLKQEHKGKTAQSTLRFTSAIEIDAEAYSSEEGNPFRNGSSRNAPLYFNTEIAGIPDPQPNQLHIVTCVERNANAISGFAKRAILTATLV